MTPEQLDEIEKLAEAATPGPWVWYGPSSDAPADLWTADGQDAIVCVQTTNADVRFIQAMRENALPLVKALREAWQERDAAKEDAKTQGAMHHRYYWRFMACAEAAGMDEQLNAEKIAKIEKERDEARAEVARLQEQVDWLLAGREQQEQRLALEVDE